MLFHCLPLPRLTQSLHLFNLAQNYTKPKCQGALCNRHCQQDDSGDDASLPLVPLLPTYFKHKRSLAFHCKLLELEMGE